jgi:DNA-binding MarR family transcriptional regulator
MEANPDDVRSFRSHLRRLERVVSAHSKRCCSQVSQAQCHVLLQIEAGGHSTTKGLAKVLNLDASTISRTVDSLVRKQFVARTENPEDRRSILLCVTQNGRKLCRNINTDADKYFGGVIDNISSKMRRSVLRSFEELVKSLVEIEERRKGSSSCCNCDPT